jgi:diguanylate cyclase (GGDEF)-like protein/putative nucleotidyltransferase with HDIG domain
LRAREWPRNSSVVNSQASRQHPEGPIDSFQPQGPARRWPLRASVAALIAGLAALAAFALLTEHRVVDEASKVGKANHFATVYQDARFWVGQDESLERKYRVEPSRQALDMHEQSGDNLIADLHEVALLQPTPATRRRVARLLALHREYDDATAKMFAATRAGDKQLVTFLDREVTDPIFSVIEADVFGAASATSRRAMNQNAALRSDESAAFKASLIAILLAVVLAVTMMLLIRGLGRGARSMRAAELKRLEILTVTDPLTSLRNHRGFYEDLERQLRRTTEAGALALVLLDVDGLRKVNNAEGHQAGDDQLRALARAIRSTLRGADTAYRVGDDEFAVLLPDAGAWAGFRLTRRIHAALEHEGEHARATAGVAEALEPRPGEELIHDADSALMAAKGSGQEAAVYTPDMELSARSPLERDGDHIRTLANSLAVAVDAKDAYTQSHSQTVANLCAAIGNELGFDAERLKRIRLAGLLHDVGKIGIPDAILRKPAKLTVGEFEQMKTHAALGADIVRAAEMPERADWIRHHHERIDGRGYPDALAGEQIPLESRIIHVADAFEAMTSDRPYRDGPGEQFAIEELRRNAGTQFDRGGGRCAAADARRAGCARSTGADGAGAACGPRLGATGKHGRLCSDARGLRRALVLRARDQLAHGLRPGPILIGVAAQQLDGVRIAVDDALEELLAVLVGRQSPLRPAANLVEQDREARVRLAELSFDLALHPLRERRRGAGGRDRDRERARAHDRRQDEVA